MWAVLHCWNLALCVAQDWSCTDGPGPAEPDWPLLLGPCQQHTPSCGQAAAAGGVAGCCHLRMQVWLVLAAGRSCTSCICLATSFFRQNKLQLHGMWSASAEGCNTIVINLVQELSARHRLSMRQCMQLLLHSSMHAAVQVLPELAQCQPEWQAPV